MTPPAETPSVETLAAMFKAHIAQCTEARQEQRQANQRIEGKIDELRNERRSDNRELHTKIDRGNRELEDKFDHGLKLERTTRERRWFAVAGATLFAAIGIIGFLFVKAYG